MAAIAMVRHQMNRLSRGRAPHPGVSPLRALVEDQLSVAWQARGHGAARNHRRLAGAQAPLSAVGSAAMTGRLVRIHGQLGDVFGPSPECHPPLDTLVLAVPVSWKGTLAQYAGRLHREHASKTDVRIIDFVDTGHPALLRMWDKRQRGYRAMGYRVDSGVPSVGCLEG
jgi:hypothetical protein